MTDRAQRRRRAGLTFALALGVVGCSDGDGGARPGADDAYIVVLDWMLDQSMVTFGEDCDDRVLYVESIGAAGIAFDVQVALIEHYTDDVDVRFIDTREEAVDDTESERPVRSGCPLIGLGPVPDGSVIEVRGELYEERDDVTGFRFDLIRRGRTWLMVEEPTRVDPEGLVDGL